MILHKKGNENPENNNKTDILEDVRKCLNTIKLSDDIFDIGVDTKLDTFNRCLNISLPFFLKRENKDYIENKVKELKVFSDNFDSLNINSFSQKKAVQNGVSAHSSIKNIVAVASGKGGVGKSSTSVNIALSLSKMEAKVGILDADIYGPSIPTMLGVFDRPNSDDGKTMNPITAKSIKMMSIGFLVDADDAIIWRAPMAVSALLQLVNDTNWGELDYLILDLPPGTGDIQLTLSQKIPVTGSIIVSTPQDIALIDARRAYNMFLKVGIDTLGVFENMATHVCKNCGYIENIFGSDGAKNMADKYDIPYLGNMPLDINIRKGLDTGNPIVLDKPDCDISLKYLDISERISYQLSKKKKAAPSIFGNIVVENKD